ncbi:MAG: acetate/propionate family kinase [Bacteroidales bacterium]|jgi:acetate kinase
MNKDKDCILTINGGSSSIKFAFYKAEELQVRLLHGKIDRIGLKDSTLTFNDEKGNQKGTLKVETSDHKTAANFLIDWLEQQDRFSSVRAVGHRVVHGMNHTEPELITSELLDELHRITPYDPDHLPGEIELIEAFRQRHPKLPQMACFDTAFHSTMPRVAKLLPIPRRFDTMGIRRYGFHGLSYAYLMEELERTAGEKTAHGRVILAHLGNGASLAAVFEGKSIDTSMGFTPAGGLMMGTRPGDLDPGASWYMMQSENLTPKQFNNLINQESGLLGVSETSSDMHDLLDNQMSDIRAAEAVELFCYQVRKRIGAFTTTLGGLDTLVFSGGIGENAPEVRARICEGLEFLGIWIEEKKNKANAPVISTDSGQATVRVIHTDEELMIAKTVSQMINHT